MVTIKVKVLDHLTKVCWLKLTIAIFSLKLSELISVDKACIGLVDASKSCVRLEVAHRCQNLPRALNR